MYSVCVCGGGVGPIIYGHLIPTPAPGYRINLSQGLLDFKAAALLQLDMFCCRELGRWNSHTFRRSFIALSPGF